VEVCSSVGLEPSTPLDQCMAKVQARIAKDGVAAPAADSWPAEGRRRCRASGIDLKVVVMEKGGHRHPTA
jgi:hypothetical protein